MLSLPYLCATYPFITCVLNNFPFLWFDYIGYYAIIASILTSVSPIFFALCDSCPKPDVIFKESVNAWELTFIAV